ncbi:MAG: hypothetical protein HY805_09735 [Nitrospirae bacterium]|nr:hypothetical protein [Nitrospirota bacterium]
MSSLLDIGVMLNNYSHDIATAFLIVGAVAMLVLSKSYPDLAHAGKDMELYYIGTNRSIMRLVKYSLIWVLIAGVPRTIFYVRYEWSNIAGGIQVAVITAKHIAMFLLVGVGLFYWLKIRKTLRSLELKHNVRQGEGG